MPDYLAQLRCRLTELGCPAALINRMVQEIADHREDLMQGASGNGSALPAVEAEAALGQPDLLAEKLMASYRQSTWCGRHPLVMFGFLPPIFPVLWFACFGFQLWVCYWFVCGIWFGWSEHKLHLACDNPLFYQRGVIAVHAANYIAIALVPALFCWLARRSAVRPVWMFVACLICSGFALLLNVYTDPHHISLSFGLTWHLQWNQGAIPILVAFVGYWHHHGRIRAVRQQMLAETVD
jgi:hypothetical protein